MRSICGSLTFVRVAHTMTIYFFWTMEKELQYLCHVRGVEMVLDSMFDFTA